MKKITITIDKQTERNIEYLSKSWNTNKSETIRTCIDQVFIDKCYNGYGIMHVPKKGGEQNAMSNAKN